MKVVDKKLAYIRKAGQVVALILQKLREEIRPGISGKCLDKMARQLMEKEKVQSSSLGYRIGDQVFPSAICVSLNEELTHGVPDDRVFKEGDLVSIDVACHYQGYHADAALTTIVGEGNEVKKNLLNITKNSLYHVIQEIIPNKTTNQNIGAMLEKYVKNRHGHHSYYLIKEYGGHGIGEELHQEPFIPNTPDISPEKIRVIKTGMFICIEPLVQIGDDKIEVSTNNGWTVFSPRGYLNAHFEHTIYINEKGAEIITNYDEST